MNIIIITNFEGNYGLKNRMSNNGYNFYLYLQKNSKYDINLIDYTKIDLINSKINPETIIIDFATGRNKDIFIKNIKCVKILEVEDIGCKCFHNCKGNNKCLSNKWISKIKDLQINHLIYRYHSPIVKKLSISKFFLPHYIDNNIFKNWNQEKKYDILIYGFIDSHIYPLRYRIFQLLKNNCEFKIKFLKHPGYSSNFKGFTGEKLSKLINQSWLTLCSASINQSLYKKYIETVFSHSLILGDFPINYENLLENNLLEISLKDSDELILNKIRQTLKDKNILQMKINKAYQIFINKFTYHQGLLDFEKIINQIKMN